MGEHPSFRNLPDGEPIKGRTFRADGWAYVDMPAWALSAWWDKARELFGEGEYFLLAESKRSTDKGDYWRGQFLLSPLAQDRFSAKRARDRGELN